MTTNQTIIEHISSTYGVQISDSQDFDMSTYHSIEREIVTLEELLSAGGKLTRVRLLTERGYPMMDVSYAYGVLADGSEVRLRDGEIDPNHRLGRKTYRSEICATIKAAGGTYRQAQQAWDSSIYSILWG